MAGWSEGGWKNGRRRGVTGKSVWQGGVEEASENGKESPHSVHANLEGTGLKCVFSFRTSLRAAKRCVAGNTSWAGVELRFCQWWLPCSVTPCCLAYMHGSSQRSAEFTINHLRSRTRRQLVYPKVCRFRSDYAALCPRIQQYSFVVVG